MALSVDWVRRFPRAPTIIKTLVEFGDVGLDTPRLRDRDSAIVFETDRTPPAISLTKTVAVKELRHGRPLPIGACVGPSHGNAPPELDCNLRDMFPVTPKMARVSALSP